MARVCAPPRGRDLMSKPRSSRERYRAFVQDYHQKRLDDANEPRSDTTEPTAPERRSKRREYRRHSVRGRGPPRPGFVFVFSPALMAAGLRAREPLFTRFIVDHILLDT